MEIDELREMIRGDRNMLKGCDDERTTAVNDKSALHSVIKRLSLPNRREKRASESDTTTQCPQSPTQTTPFPPIQICFAAQLLENIPDTPRKPIKLQTNP